MAGTSAPIASIAQRMSFADAMLVWLPLIVGALVVTRPSVLG